MGIANHLVRDAVDTTPGATSIAPQGPFEVFRQGQTETGYLRAVLRAARLA